MSWTMTAEDWKDKWSKKGYEKVFNHADDILREMWFAGSLPNPYESSLYSYDTMSVVSDREGDKELNVTITMVNDEGKNMTATFTFKAGITFTYTIEDEDDRWGYYVDKCYINVPFEITADFVDKSASAEEKMIMYKTFYDVIKGEKN